MKTLEQMVEDLEAQLAGTRKLLAEIRADRLKREQARTLAENSPAKELELA